MGRSLNQLIQCPCSHPKVSIVIWGNSAVQVTPATTYKHFRNVPRMKPPFTNVDIGNQYTTFDWPSVIDLVLLDWLS